MAAAVGPRGSLRQELDGFQRTLISEVLAQHDGNWASAARALGLDRGNLHRLATRLGLRKHTSTR